MIRSTAIIATFVTLLFAAGPSFAQSERTLDPIGGEYTSASLQGFARVVMQHASGPTVDIVVVPAAYGTKPSIHQNTRTASKRTTLIELACRAVLPEFPQFKTCNAKLLIVFQRSDAHQKQNAEAFADPQTDGAFFLGGDQALFMNAVANTPLERAMSDAYERGVVYGGTSAGDAVESSSMIWGFTRSGSQENALQEPSVLVWWADAVNGERGLDFGSQRAIFDQHFYQMGRFGRLLNAIAQSDDHFDGASRVGVGFDAGTGAPVQDDTTVSGVFGSSSAAVVDDETAGATHQWEGTNQALSSRDTLTHIIPTGDYAYDLATRTPVVHGVPVPFVSPGPWTAGLLHQPGAGPLILAGGVTNFTGPVMQDFVQRAQSSGRSQLLLVFAGYVSTEAANRDVKAYRSGVVATGWNQTVRTLVYGKDALNQSLIDQAAGVLLVGGDQSALATPVGDPAFRSFVRAAVQRAPVVMTDHAMTAAMGDRYSASPDPTAKTLSSQAIADFASGEVPVEPGLGIVPGAAFEPRLTVEYRWGRLYSLSMADPGTIVFGISNDTAIMLRAGAPSAIGKLSVVSADGRAATFDTGDNGALAAFNVLMNVYAPGDGLT